MGSSPTTGTNYAPMMELVDIVVLETTVLVAYRFKSYWVHHCKKIFKIYLKKGHILYYNIFRKEKYKEIKFAVSIIQPIPVKCGEYVRSLPESGVMFAGDLIPNQVFHFF